MMWPLTSLALRHPAMSSINLPQRSTTVAAIPGLAGLAHSARRSCSSFSRASRTRIFSAAFSSTAPGDSPVSAVFPAASVAASTRASSISRSNKSSRRLRASGIMGLLQAALVLDQLVGDPGRIDLISSGPDGLFNRRYFAGIYYRGLGDGFFDSLQRARGVGQGDMVPGRGGCCSAGPFARRLVSDNAVAGRTRRLCDRLRRRYSTDFVSHRSLLRARSCPCIVIVRIWMNFNEFVQNHPLLTLSAVKELT